MAEALIWLVPAAALAGGIRDPRGGLVVLAACFPLFASPPGGPYLGAFDAAALIAIAGAWRGGRAPRARLDWPAWAFVAVTATSLAPIAYHPPSWEPRILLRLLMALPDVEPWTTLFGWRAMASLCIGIGLFWAVRRAFAGRSLQPLFLALAAGLAATLILGLVSHTGLIELEFFRAKGGPLWEERLHSLAFHSGWLAEFIVLVTPVAAAALFALPKRGPTAAAVLVALAVPTVFLTAQRGAWLTALGQVGLAVLLWGRSTLRSALGRRAVLASLGLVAVVTGLVLLVEPDLFGPALERTRIAFEGKGRPSVWAVSLDLAAERPLLGWGVGGFSPLYHDVVGAAPPTKFDWLTAHSQYVMLAVERGLLGLLAFFWLCWALGESLYAGRESERPEHRRLAFGLVLSYAALLSYGVVQYMFFLRMIEWLFWMLAGASAVLTSGRGSRPLRRAAQATLVLAVLLAPWRALAVEPLRAAGDRAFGFHRPEASRDRAFQWCRAYCVWRHRLEGDVLELELANGHPRPAEHPVHAVVRVDGREVLRAEIPGEWRTYAIDPGPSGSESVLVEIEAHPAFRPFLDYRRYPDLDPSVDIRALGVAVSPPPTGKLPPPPGRRKGARHRRDRSRTGSPRTLRLGQGESSVPAPQVGDEDGAGSGRPVTNVIPDRLH